MRCVDEKGGESGLGAGSGPHERQPGAAMADLQERDLSRVAFPDAWVDGTYLKCQDAGHMSSYALVTE